MKTQISKKDASTLNALKSDLAHVEKMIDGLYTKNLQYPSETIDRLLANKLSQKEELLRFIASIERKYN